MLKKLIVAALSALALASPAAAQAPDLTLPTNERWICSGPVNLGTVRVNMQSVDLDAVSLRNCSGSVQRLEVIQNTNSDGVKGQNAAGGFPHDLVVHSGFVRCTGPHGDHQDGISIMGGRDITFRNFVVDCSDMTDVPGAGLVSAWSPSEGGAGASTPTRVVLEHGVLMEGSMTATVVGDGSIDSGVRNSTVCADQSPNTPRYFIRAGVDTFGWVWEGNTEPPVGATLCTDFNAALAWAAGTTPDPDPDPDPPYAPACAPTCDEQIAALTAERDAAQDDAAAQSARADTAEQVSLRYRGYLEQIRNLALEALEG